MRLASLLYARSHAINDKISIMIPKVGEIMDNEDAYYDAVYSVIATPYEMMVQLDDAGIDFTKINAFELFCLMMPNLKRIDTSLVFGDLNLQNFRPAIKEDDKTTVLWDKEADIVIDRALHNEISEFLRKILYMPKNDKRPGNDAAKAYMIERARVKQKRRMKKKKESQLEKLIVALVNTGGFPYNYESVRDITIYQLYASLKQITHKIHFDNTMVGLYSGSIKFADLSEEEKSWILPN